VEIDNMNIGEVKSYAKAGHDGWQDLIGHEEQSMGSICVNV